MADLTPPVTDRTRRPPRRRRLARWFWAGFLVAFLGLAIVYPMRFYDGGAVRQTTLWQYYLLEIQLQARSTGNLGPTSGNATAALTTAVMHVLVSAAVGALVMGFAWVCEKRSKGA
jgi:hypothetical protein